MSSQDPRPAGPHSTGTHAAAETTQDGAETLSRSGRALIPQRVGRDASRIADEVLVHLVGLVGSQVRVTLEIEVTIPGGAPDQVVRTVTENGRTLKFTDNGFEME